MFQFLLIFNWIQYKPMNLGNYIYPLWANVLGWIVALAPVVAVPIIMIYKLSTAPSNMNLKEVKNKEITFE